MANPHLRKYPTPWQRKTMWASLTAVFLVALVGIVGSAVWLAGQLIGYLQPILIPVAIAVILAYLLDPLVTYWAERGYGRAKAIGALFTIAFLALAGVLTWVVPTISMQSASVARELPAYTSQARDKVVDLIYQYNHTFGAPAPGKFKSTSTASKLVNWLLASPTPAPADEAPPVISPQLNEPPAAAVPSAATSTASAPAPKLTSAERQRIQEWVERQLPNIQAQLPTLAEKFWNLLKTSIGGFLGITGFLLSLVMVPIYLFFLLKERPGIERRWKEYLPLRNSPLKDEVAAVLMQINSYVIAYFRGQLLVCLIDGALIGASLMLLGLNFAPLIGVLVVLLTMIPYIGIVLCWIPAVLIAAAQWGDWMHPLIVTALFFGIQNLEAIFIAPRIVGNSVGLHPMTVIVSIFVWGLLIGGLLGPILAVPLTATVKVLLARYVWGRRLRERMTEQIEEVPVVRKAEEHAVA
ncbi:MAG: AI-2E family transporter [Chthoniobacterales bacterium]|nr:AI-2E family transporter [Chthoniobacterales bacterium]